MLLATAPLRVIDLFCGAGGLSLGLKRAGLHVVLSNEFSADAEWTYRANHLPETLIEAMNGFPLVAHDFGYAAEKRHRLEFRKYLLESRKNDSHTQKMRGGDIRTALSNDWLRKWLNHNEAPDLIMGGPPCQGFSAARGRLVHDERNQLVHEYLRVVKALIPKMVVIENVPGMVERHPNVIRELGNCLLNSGYIPRVGIVSTSSFGVPQSRRRVLIIALRDDQFEDTSSLDMPIEDDVLLQALIPIACPRRRADALSNWHALTTSPPDTAGNVLGDLSDQPPFHGNIPAEGVHYRRGHNFENMSTLARELRAGRSIYLDGKRPQSQDDLVRSVFNHEISRHSHDVRRRFNQLRHIAERNPEHRCHSGFLIEEVRKLSEGRDITGKASQRVLLRDHPPHITITSLPDDLLHYEQPRILTVRECARLQTFPDWYAFKGVRNTCSTRRREGKFVPQYTQVANGVPPRLAHGIAQRVKDFLALLKRERGNIIPENLPHGPYHFREHSSSGETISELNKHFIENSIRRRRKLFRGVG